jgi:PAS domain S-box-containing protein
MDISPAMVFDEVERLLKSHQFARSHRLTRFVRFTVSETLEERGSQLTEHMIGTRVYDRPPDFDPKLDGIVRAEARRLRKKLAQYYAREGRRDPLVIEYPSGSYAPAFRNAAARLTLDFLAGGGEMAQRIRQFDWASTTLSSIEGWSHGLRTAIGICLRSKAPAAVLWGSRLSILYNDSFASAIGSRHPDILGLPVRDVLKESWHRFGPALESAMRGGSSAEITGESFLFHHEGRAEERYFNLSCTPITEASRPTGVFVTGTETTHRVLAERRLRTLWDLATRTAGAGDISGACRAIASALRENRSDIPLASLYSISDDLRAADLEAAVNLKSGTPISPKRIELDDPLSFLAPIIRSGVVQVIDLGPASGLLFPQAGRESPESVAVLPIRTADEADPAGVLIAGLNPYQRFDEEYRRFLDLIARLCGRAFAQAGAARNSAPSEELARLKTRSAQFLTKASASLRGSLALLMLPMQDQPPAERERFKPAERATAQLLELVDVLEDFVAIEADANEAYYEPVDLAAFTGKVAETFRSAIERAGIRYIVDTPALKDTAHVDPLMWEKIVLNLLSNAFKYTARGEITVTLRMLGGQFLLEVLDTGIGIPRDQIERLFDPFTTLPGVRSRTRSNLGMGLVRSRTFVELHGGSLSVLSEEGKGTRVIASIPQGSAHLPPLRIVAPSAKPWSRAAARALIESASWPWERVAVTKWGSRRLAEGALGHVIIAEDDRDMRDYLVALLSSIYTTEAVRDATQVIDAARAYSPDLILAEASLPATHGVELVQTLRSDAATRTVPLILLSDLANEDLRLNALSAGADDYILKPFSGREILVRTHSQIVVSRRRRPDATEDSRIQGILNSIDDGLWITDLQGRTMGCNVRMSAMLGYDVDEFRTLSLIDCIVDEDRNRVSNLLQRAYAGDRAPFVLRFRTKAGTVLRAHLTPSPIHAERGSVESVLLRIASGNT